MSNLIIKKTENKTNGNFSISFSRGFDQICSWTSDQGETLSSFESRIHTALMENVSEYISIERETKIVIDNRIGTDEVPVQEPTKEDRERLMYGFTVAELKEDYLQWNPADDPRSMLMRSMGILSDVQERISRGSITDEEIRQTLNQSKFWISESRTFIPRDPVPSAEGWNAVQLADSADNLNLTDEETFVLDRFEKLLEGHGNFWMVRENGLVNFSVDGDDPIFLKLFPDADRFENPEGVVRRKLIHLTAQNSPSCTCAGFLPSIGLHAPDCPSYVKKAYVEVSLPAELSDEEKDQEEKIRAIRARLENQMRIRGLIFAGTPINEDLETVDIDPFDETAEYIAESYPELGISEAVDRYLSDTVVNYPSFFEKFDVIPVDEDEAIFGKKSTIDSQHTSILLECNHTVQVHDSSDVFDYPRNSLMCGLCFENKRPKMTNRAELGLESLTN